jgi:mono/diheme cytochrome c family protein
MALLARFQSVHRIGLVVERLREAGIADNNIEVLSDRPLRIGLSSRAHRLVGVAVVAGLAGILLGVGLAAGTALLYPIKTGGKPIVAVPIVGLIAYETMMLCAIVATITAMAIGVIRSSRRASGVPELHSGEAAVIVRLDDTDSSNEAVQNILHEGDVIRLPRTSQRPIYGWSLILALSLAASACTENMTEQPSYRPQEAPRLHSPAGSVPRLSRVHRSGKESTSQGGERLFRINCAHCHGSSAEGDGPVAPFLEAPPANLRAPKVQGKPPSALYAIITDGEKSMPAFKGELSADERWALVDFIGSLD